jgi:hypothetical protein
MHLELILVYNKIIYMTTISYAFQSVSQFNQHKLSIFPYQFEYLGVLTYASVFPTDKNAQHLIRRFPVISISFSSYPEGKHNTPY